MPQTILFKFTAQDIGVAKAQDGVKDRLKEINREIKQAKQLGNPYDKLLGESVKLNRETARLRDEQKNLNREFAATKVPKDSLAGLRLEYSRLIEKVKELSAAERASPAGQALINNTANVRKQVSDIEATLGRFTNNVGNYKSAISGVVKLFPLLGAGIGVGEIVNSTREFERLFAVLKQATGNESTATKTFKDIQEFAKETPFQINELVGAFVKLENRNFNPTIESLRTIGDIAASQGKTVDQFTEAILDAQTGEFERLKEFGIVARKQGDDLRVTFRGQSETFKNTTENVTKYLLKIGELPGIQGSAVAVSKTLDGSLSNLVDNFTQLFAKIGSGGGILKAFVDGINSIVGGVNDLLDTPLSEEIGNQQREFNSLIGVLQDVNTSEGERNRIIGELKKEYPQYLKFVTDDAKGQIDLAKTLEFGNGLFEKRIILESRQEQLTKLTKDRIAEESKLTEALKAQQAFVQKGVKATTNEQIVKRAGLGADVSVLSVQDQARTANDLVAGARLRIEGLNKEISALTTNFDETAIRTTGKTIAELDKEINGLFGDTEKPTSGGGVAGKAKAFSGSLNDLNEQLDKLQEKILNTPGGSPLLTKLIKDSVDLEQKIQSLNNIIAEIRNPTVELTDEQKALELVTGIDPEQALKQAKLLRDQLGAELGGLKADQPEDPLALIAFQLDKSQAEKDSAADDQKIEKQKRVNEALIDGAVNAAQTIADATFQIQQNQLQKEQDAKLTALDKQEQAAIDAANGNATKEKLIRADFEKRRAVLEKKFANDRKEQARKEALINIALSVTKALTGGIPPFNLILAGLATIAGAAQLAVINSQEFAGGGTVKRLGPGVVRERQNAPRTAHGDTVLAYLKPGEMMLNEEQQRRIAGMAGGDIFQKAGVPGSGRGGAVPFFASGGVVDFIPQATFSNQAQSSLSVQASAQFSDEQVADIGQRLGSKIAATVANEIKFALAEGLYDANRRLDREAAAESLREG